MTIKLSLKIIVIIDYNENFDENEMNNEIISIIYN